MRLKKLHEQKIEDDSWFQTQPSLIPWELGKEKLEQIFDRILDKNREEFFEKPIDRKHADRSTYSLRLRHCLKYHWEKVQQTKPRCIASKVVKDIYKKYQQQNVFDSVVLAVAVVLQEFKSRVVFRPLYDRTFNSVEYLPPGSEDDHDDCREYVFDQLAGGLSDEQEQELNVILAGMENGTLELLKKAIIAFKNLDQLEKEEVLDTVLVGLESDTQEWVKTVILNDQLKPGKLDLVTIVKSTDLNPAKLDLVKNGRLIDYEGKGSFILWLRKTINRRIASYYRIKHDSITPDVPSQVKSPFHQAALCDEAAKLRRVMDQCLTPHERNMFEDYNIHDMTLDEICEKNRRLGRQPTDKGNLSKKLKEIREKIKSHWGNS